MPSSSFAPPVVPRALHVVGYLHGNDGITTHLMSLSDGVRRRGGTVGVASCVRAAPAYHVEARGGDWYAAQGVPRFFVPFPDPQRPDRQSFDGFRALRGLYDAVREFRPDVLHLHSLSLFPYAWAVRGLTGVPIVSTIHLEPDPRRTGVRLLGAVNRLLPLRPDGLIALCREQEAFFQSILRARAEQIFRIPHGIDPAHFRPPQPSERAAARRQFGLSAGEPTVAMVGRLDAVKGHDVLIRALARLHAQGRSVTALFAGTGAGEADIRRQVAEVGLTEAVRFLGFADSREVLWAADVSVLPSRREAFPLVTLEAMLCGVVPIRTPASGARDQIRDGETGFLIPFDDDQALANRLERLMADPDRRVAMATAALHRARTHFTADVMIDRTLAAYAAVSGKRRIPTSPRRADETGARVPSLSVSF